MQFGFCFQFSINVCFSIFRILFNIFKFSTKNHNFEIFKKFTKFPFLVSILRFTKKLKNSKKKRKFTTKM